VTDLAAKNFQVRSILRTTRASAPRSLACEMTLQAQSQVAAAPPSNVRTSYPFLVRTIPEELTMAITASKLRADVYRLLDEILESGQPLEIERNGKILVIAPKEEQSIWDRLPRRKGFIVGDPDELIHVDWSSEWNPDPS
jgi:hypothetical protein